MNMGLMAATKNIWISTVNFLSKLALMDCSIPAIRPEQLWMAIFRVCFPQSMDWTNQHRSGSWSKKITQAKDLFLSPSGILPGSTGGERNITECRQKNILRDWILFSVRACPSICICFMEGVREDL